MAASQITVAINISDYADFEASVVKLDRCVFFINENVATRNGNKQKEIGFLEVVKVGGDNASYRATFKKSLTANRSKIVNLKVHPTKGLLLQTKDNKIMTDSEELSFWTKILWSVCYEWESTEMFSLIFGLALPVFILSLTVWTKLRAKPSIDGKTRDYNVNATVDDWIKGIKKHPYITAKNQDQITKTLGIITSLNTVNGNFDFLLPYVAPDAVTMDVQSKEVTAETETEVQNNNADHSEETTQETEAKDPTEPIDELNRELSEEELEALKKQEKSKLEE